MEHEEEKCHEVFSLLSQYLDVELPPETCQEVERHLAGCLPCIEFAQSLRKTVELCRQYAPEEMPSPLTEKTRNELLAAWRKMLELKR